MPALVRNLAIAPVLMAALVSFACGDDGGSGDPSDQVTKVVEQAFPSADVSASCPDDASGSFDCDVTVGSQQVKVPVEDVDGTAEVKAALVNLGDTERRIETEYDQQNGVAVSAECGDKPDEAVLVDKPGATFTCSIEQSDGSTSQVTVTVENLDGKVSFSL
ncbi:MAG: hypothetical protein ACRDWD_11745 [Acidimicrobiia bacterium]